MNIYDQGFRHLKAGRLSQALDLFNISPNQDRKYVQYLENKRQYGRARVFVAQAQLSRNDSVELLGKAEQILHSIIERSPKFAPAYVCLGRVYELNGENDMAIKTYEQGLEQSPQNEQLLGCLEYLNQELLLASSPERFTPLKDSQTNEEEQPVICNTQARKLR